MTSSLAPCPLLLWCRLFTGPTKCFHFPCSWFYDQKQPESQAPLNNWNVWKQEVTLSYSDPAHALHQQPLTTRFRGRSLRIERSQYFKEQFMCTFGKGWATCFKNSTYTCLGMALYVIHSGGMLIANFYVGLFMHVFLVFPNIIHCHIWKKVKTLATSVIQCKLSMGGGALREDGSLAEAKERFKKAGDPLTLWRVNHKVSYTSQRGSEYKEVKSE